MANNNKVVRTFLDIWNGRQGAAAADPENPPIDWNEHGSTKRAWGDIMDKMPPLDMRIREDIMKFWPKE